MCLFLVILLLSCYCITRPASYNNHDYHRDCNLCLNSGTQVPCALANLTVTPSYAADEIKKLVHPSPVFSLH